MLKCVLLVAEVARLRGAQCPNAKTGFPPSISCAGAGLCRFYRCKKAFAFMRDEGGVGDSGQGGRGRSTPSRHKEGPGHSDDKQDYPQDDGDEHEDADKFPERPLLFERIVEIGDGAGIPQTPNG